MTDSSEATLTDCIASPTISDPVVTRLLRPLVHFDPSMWSVVDLNGPIFYVRAGGVEFHVSQCGGVGVWTIYSYVRDQQRMVPLAHVPASAPMVIGDPPDVVLAILLHDLDAAFGPRAHRRRMFSKMLVAAWLGHIGSSDGQWQFLVGANFSFSRCVLLDPPEAPVSGATGMSYPMTDYRWSSLERWQNNAWPLGLDIEHLGGLIFLGALCGPNPEFPAHGPAYIPKAGVTVDVSWTAHSQARYRRILAEAVAELGSDCLRDTAPCLVDLGWLPPSMPCLLPAVESVR